MANGRFFKVSRERQDLLRARLEKEGLAASAPGAEARIPRREGAGPAPLSFSQQRLWVVQRMDPGSSAYNIPGGLRLRGRLDLPALAASLDEIVRRHEVLRTVFRAEEGRPVQVPQPHAAPLILPLADLGAVPPERREAEVRRLAAEEAGRPFDLERGPVFRTALLRLDPEDHVLLVTFHHIAADGWSMGVLVRELTALYAAFGRGEPIPPPALPPLPVQYADFAAWQRQALAGDALAEEISWWRERLDGVAVLELPTDHPRPAVQSLRGGVLPVALPAAASGALRALAQERGATPFLVLLALFQALLHRYTGQDDIAVGTPVANRRRGEVEGLIGFFVNTVVVRTSLAGDPAFAELLDRVREAGFGAFAHQDLPFEKLVEELRPERDLSRPPLFQALFALQNAGTGALELPGLTLEELGPVTGGAKLDLSLSLAEGAPREGEPEGFAGLLEYSRDLFDPPTMARFAEHLAALAEGAAASPDRRLSELPLLPAPERHQLIHEWNDTRVERDDLRLAPELIAEQAAERPQAVALIAGEDRLTYAELDARAVRLARSLRARGVGPDVLVALFFERTLALGVAVAGVLRSGGAWVPLDPGLPAQRLAFFVADSGAPLLITERRLLERIPEPLGNLLDGSRVLCLEDLEGTPEADLPDAIPLDAISPDGLAYVIYTSGSTGLPKAVQIEHRSLAEILAALRRQFAWGPGEVLLSVSSFLYDGFVLEVVTTLAGGGTVVLAPMSPLQPERLAKLLTGSLTGTTRMHAVPSLARRIVAAVDPEDTAAGRYDGFRTLFLGGEHVPLELLRDLQAAFPAADVHVLYGPTEGTILCSSFTAPAGTPAEKTRIGRPLENVELRVCGPHGGLVPIGVPGEVWIGGAGLARGYLGREALTAERFPVVEGRRWYRTGDLARWSADGQLEFLGRIDHQVKLRGYRIELGEIEAALLASPAVRETVVLLREDAPGQARLAAYLVPRETAGLPEDWLRDLRRDLAERLPDYMVPAAFVVLEAMPITSNGKLDRAGLPAPEEAGADRSAAPPRTPAEEILAGIWAEVLGLESASAGEDFFARGGHSLTAAQLVARAERAFGVEIPLRTLFAAPTVALFAAEVERALAVQQGGEPPPLVPVPRRGDLPLSFVQQRFWLAEQLLPGTARYNVPFALRLYGQLDVAALEKALAEVVRRHEALRTVFPERDGEPVQVIQDGARLTLPLLDLSGQPEAEAEAERLATEEARQPFDIAAGPLVRAALLRLAAEDHALVVNLHHLVADGWSTGILVRELAALYGAFTRGEASPLPELAVQYADFAVWQRQWLSGGVLAEQLGWWRGRLAGDLEAVELPLDRSRPAVPSFAGDTRARLLPADLAADLAAFSRRRGATLFMTLAAGFAALLRRYGTPGSLVVGTHFANRDRPEVEGLVGCFVNTLPLRLDPAPTFAGQVDRTREALLEVFARRHMPFEKLVEELGRDRGQDQQPFFNVTFGLHDLPTETALELPGLTVTPAEPRTGTAKFDLVAAVSRTPEGLVASAEYRTDLFDGATVERLLDHFLGLLAAAVAAPDLPLSELPLLTEAESRLLAAQAGPAAAFSVESCLHEVFHEQARLRPEAPAVSCGDDLLTYGELAARAYDLAGRLRELGAGPETRVALRAERSVDLVVGVVGILTAGAAYVPLDPAYPQERLEFILADAEVPLVVEVPRRATVDIARGGNPGRPAVRRSHLEAGPENLAYVIYTSGSTGRPKGVGVTHAKVLRLFAATRDRFAFGPSDVWTLFHSYAFDFSVWEIWGALLHGGRLVVVPYEVSRSPEAFHRLLAEERVTVLSQTPSAFRQLAWAEEETAAPNLALRLVIFGGEALDLPSLAPWIDRHGDDRPELWNLYGITETTVHVTWRRIRRADLKAGGSPVGVPLPDLSVHLLDPAGQPVPWNVPGEIHVGGAGVARGYLGRPDLTAERFVPDPFGPPGARLYRSGDLARRRPDGGLDYLGRIDHQVKVRGFRIELGEIEAALQGHPDVREAAVVLRGDGDDRSLVAYLAPAGLDPASLRAYLQARLPEPLVPAGFVGLDALPLTANGKVDRRALPAPAPREATAAFLPPRTPLEREVAAVWEEVLGSGRVGARDDFFALGGHSLLATRVVSRLRRRFGVELRVRDLFDEPTVAGLAGRLGAALEAGGGEGLPAILPAPPEAREAGLPLSFAQQRLWFLDQLHPGDPSYNMAFPVRLRGPLDADALETAWAEAVRRHESQRTVFMAEDGKPVQRVVPAPDLRLPRIDLAGLPEPAREAEAARLREEAAEATFDLARGPLYRVRLVRLGAAEHLFLLVQHHIVSDGWSAGLLVREVADLYAAFAGGRPSPLAELALQYGDFAWWQRQYLQGEILEAQLGYWKEILGGDLPGLTLPTDRPRPAEQAFQGARESRLLPPELARAVHGFGGAEGATLFMTLLAAFGAVLGRWAGQDDLTVGTPIAGRNRAETEGMVGFFVNTLVMRLDLAGGPGFRGLLARVRERALGAFAHQDLPFERLVEELHPQRDLARTPLFQVFFNVLNLDRQRIEMPGLSLELEAGEAAPSKFDLTLYAAEGEGRDGPIRLDLVYNAELFDAARMRELLAQIETFLSAAVERPEEPVGRLSLVTREAAAVLPSAAAPLPALGGETPVHARFARRALRVPERPALLDTEGVWGYGELNTLANALAQRLRSGGLQAGEAVAVYGHRGAALVWALLGVLKAGGAFVILDPEYPAPRLAERVRRAAPRAWIALEAAGPLPADLEALSPALRLRLPASLADARRAFAGAPSWDPDVDVALDALAYLAFTSGSTGAPKGILGTHRPLAHFVDWQAATFRLSERDRFALLGGLSHDPLLRDVFTPLAVGATLCVPTPEILLDGSRLVRWLADNRVTVVHLTPALSRLMTLSAAPGSLRDLRLAFFGGDVLTPREVERLRRLAPDVECVNFYGTTETPQAMAFHPVTEDAPPVPVGRGIEGVQLLVINPAGILAGVGELGEVQVRTPYLSQGYLGDEELTRERFRVNPWTGDAGDRVYRTGDLGRYRPDGAVVLAGRADDQVQVRGFRVELGEIAAVLEGHPAVRESIVVAREDEPGAEPGEIRLVAYYAAAADLAAALRDLLRRQLPAYMVPAAFVRLDRLPRNRAGKVERKALPALAGPLLPVETGGRFRPPRTPAEQVLAGIWQEVLGVERVGAGDSFFDLGGHSLLATQVVARLRDALEIELPVRALFEDSTLAGLARRIEDAVQEATAPPLPPLRPLPREDADLPLSFAQTRLWFLDRLEGPNPSYNMPAAVRLRGELDLPALERTLEEVARRHEVLRTSYPTVDGRARVEVAPPRPVRLPVIDLSGLPNGESEAARLAREEAGRTFDIGKGPLWRAAVLRLTDRDHLVLLTLHHIVSDGWSMGVLVREISEIYPASAAGRPSPLPELPVQYADYAAWQRERLRGDRLDALLGFWRQRLAGMPPLLDLPADRPRPAVRSPRGGRRPLVLPPDLTGGLRALASGTGATLFMGLLAAFAAFLHRLTGQERFAVGTPIAGRERPELEGLIGFFANTLALPVDLAGEPSFVDVLLQAQDTALAAYSHQDLPFEKLVDELDLPRDLGHTPLFQVMLALQGTPSGPRTEGDGQLMMEAVAVDSGTAKFDWTLFAVETPDGLSAALEYSADRFDAATVDRFLESFTVLLEATLADPARPLSALPLLSEPARRQILGDWNAGDPAAPEPVLIHRRFEAQAARSPHIVAVIHGETRLTFRELDRRSNRLARAVAARGVGPEVVVGLRLGRSPELVTAILAVLKAGGAYLPLDPAHPEERQAALLDDAGARLVLTPDDFTDIPGPDEPLPSPVLADNLAYVLYTSGSTGRPKGVMVSHRGVACYVDWAIRAYEVEAGRGAPVHSSVAFDLTVTSLFAPLLAGRAVTLLPEVEGGEALAAAVKPGARYSLVKLTPAHLDVLRESMLRQGTPGAVAGWTRALVVGGEALQGSGLAFWRENAPETRIFNEYGPTETVVGCAVYEVPPGLSPEGPVPIGRPAAGARLYVVDRYLQPVPAGVPGELLIAREGMARGYRGRPAETAERFLPDPLAEEPGDRVYRSGDRVRLRTDGELVFLGRADDQLKIRGFRIEPAEVEAALARHPAVREGAAGAVVGRLAAWVVLREGSARPTVSDLRDFLKRSLPEAMVPSAFVFLDALPLTPNGKVDRRALPAPGGERPDLARGYAAPRTPAEEILAALWGEVLGIDRVGVHDNFFELGGDSILSIQIVSRARQAGLDLAPRDVFEHQTVAGLAAVARPVGAVEIPQGPVTGEVPLTPIQRWFFAQEQPEPHHWNQALLLESAEPLDSALLERAVTRLLEHHDALRLRFHREGAVWRQEIVPPGEGPSAFAALDLSSLPEDRRRPALEEAAARLQESLDLGAGPLCRFALFQMEPGTPDRLLAVIHHLAVDAVSWRILLEDLETAYRQRTLLPKTTSYQAWAESVAQTLAPLEEALPELPLPLVGDPEENTEAESRTLGVELDAEETRALLQEVPDAYNTRIDDALVTALARAVSDWTGASSIPLDLEGHGRDGALDLTRTVGWFTAIRTVRLEVPGGEGVGQTLQSTKEALRPLPRSGGGLGRGPLAFNYLGRLDSALPASSPFSTAAEDPGPTRSPRSRRPWLLEVGGAVSEGRLRMAFRYGGKLFREEDVARLATAFLAELRGLIEHCRSLEVCGYTPSDFPEAGRDAAGLRRALAELAPALPSGRERWVESIDPLSPAQQGMLLESVQGQPGLHVEQLALVWEGALNAGAFEQAWKRLLARHPALRTAFLWRDQPAPLQAVLRRVDLPLLREDWRELPEAEQEERLAAFLAVERHRGFDLSRPPLLRLALIRTGEERHRLVWTYHHILLDGWCRQIVMGELQTLYAAALRGEEAVLPPARPYRDYLAWLRRQAAGEDSARAFWRRTLRGFSRPTPLGRPAEGSPGPSSGERHSQRELRLTREETAALAARVRSRRATLNTLAQGIWALLLRRYAGEEDVVFGITVSGRPPDLPGIESTVGLFLNTVPLRVRTAGSGPLWPWLREIQEHNLELRRFETTPAGTVRAASEVPEALPLFESLLVFENYPVPPSNGEEPGFRLEAGDFRSVGARTRYPLTLLVLPGEELTVRLIADGARISPEDADRVAAHFAGLLRAVAGNPEPRLGDLLAGVPEEEAPRVFTASVPSGAAPSVVPRSPLEEAVAGLWAEVLGTGRRIGVHDDFFALGGHSLLATRLTAALREAFGVDLPLRALFAAPTVAGVAAEVARLKGGTGNLGEAPWPRIVPDPERRHLPFPLTDVQQAYWVGRGGAFELGNVATHLYLEVDARGLDLERLEGAWNRLVERHDMLRAVVQPDGLQRILPAAEVPAYEIAVEEQTEAALLELRERMSHQVLPADRWPLFEIRASLLPDGRTRLQVSLDLLIGDAWSWRLLSGELARLYAAPDAPLEPLALSFRDYILAEAALRETALYRRDLDYWRARLAELPPAPELPLAQSPSALEVPRFRRRTGTLESGDWDRLKARAARSGLTPSGVLLAAFSEVLATWSRAPRFTLNLTLFNRLPLHPEVDRVVGDFTSLTLLEVDLSIPGEGFEARARRLQERLWADLDHRLVSGVAVMRELARFQGTPRGTGVMPVVFTSTLALGSGAPTEAPPEEEGGGSVNLVYAIGQTPQVWLDHQVTEREGQLVYNWDAVEDLFPAGLLDSMFDAFGRLLDWLVAGAEGDWNWREEGRTLVPAADLALAASANDTAVPDDPTALLHDGFREQAERHPGRPAVIAPDRTWTYGELREAVDDLAGRLREAGAAPGDLVAVVLPKGWEQAVATLAILEVGAAYVPVAPDLPEERRRVLFEQSGARIGVFPAAPLTPWPPLPSPPLPPGEGERYRAGVPVDLVILSTAKDLGGGDLHGTLSATSPLSRGKGGRWERGPGGEGLAYVIFTSGSTGQPKGVAIDHRGAVNTLADLNRRFGVGSEDRVLALSSLSFDLSVYDLFGLWAAGGAAVLPASGAGRDPAHWLERMAAGGVTVWNSVPALLEMLVEHLEGRGGLLPDTLRLVMLSGDWIPVNLPDRVRALSRRPGGVEIISLGGATEASIWSIHHPIREVDPSWRSIPYGRPLANQTIHIFDGELAERPVWVPGDLYIGGTGVALGYWGDEEKTRAAFSRHPRTGERLYRTGDLGRRLPDGAIEFLGRQDGQVKIQGYRIELGEIEAALAAHPALSAAVAAAEGPARGTRRLVGYVVPAAGQAPPSADELRRFLAERLPAYMIPALFVPLERVPLTANGKVDRAALAAARPLEEGKASESVPPRNPTEEVVAAVWGELLDLDRLGVFDDVFALGGQSLLATQAASRLSRAFGVEIPLRDLFEAVTVAELAARITALRERADGLEVPPIVPRGRAAGEGLPLSFAQERLWFLEQLEPETAVHHIPAAVRLTGRLDREAFAAALAGVARRHEILRTTFAVQAGTGRPVQIVAPAPADWILPLVDLAALPASAREAEAGRLRREEPRRLFDLERGPLWRANLLRLGQEEHVLLVTQHHLVSDGWSLAVLIGEVSALYTAFLAGRPDPLPPLPVQYADYAAWQREHLAGPVLEAQLAYWRERLSGGLPILELPADRQRPPFRSYRGGKRRALLPPDLSRDLQALGRREGATLFMTLLAGLEGLLARLTGQTGLLVGSPVAGRNRPEIEGLIGLFVNTLVLRADLFGDPGFRDLIGRARREALDAYAHQDLPFEKLVEELNPERNLRHTAVFQVLFALQNAPRAMRAADLGDSPGLAMELLPQEGDAAKFDLTLTVFETPEGLAGAWVYNADLFDPVTVDRFAAAFETLLAGAVAEPDRRLSRLPLLSAAQEHQIRIEANDTRSPFAADLPIHRLFERRVARTPDAPAAVCEGESLSYRELDERANRLARFLRARGVGPESTVGLLLEPSLHLPVALLGVYKAGGAYVGLDPAAPRERLVFQIEDSRALLVLTEDRLAEALGPEPPAPVLRLDSGLPLADSSPLEPTDDVDHLAYVIYTSGSTGRPKGVLGTHRQLLSYLHGIVERLEVPETASWTMHQNLGVDAPITQLYATLCRGGVLHLLPPLRATDGAALAEYVRGREIDYLKIAPSHLAALLAACDSPADLLPRRLLMVGGEALRREWAEGLQAAAPPNCVVLNHYGPTETTCGVLTCRVLDLPPEETAGLSGTVPIGRPLANVRAYLLDAALEPSPLGVPGELCIGGPGVARGYRGRPDLTATRFIPDDQGEEPGGRLYRTGDLVRLRPDGRFEFLGRIDHQVKVRGYRVELEEIEVALGEEPGVRVAVVLAEPAPSGESRLVACLVAEAPDPASLRRSLLARLPEYMVPAGWLFLDAMPRTPQGKVDRQALARIVRQRGAEWAGEMRTDAEPYLAPRTAAERAVVGIWAEVLGRDPEKLGVRDNFFDAGGHSLLATRVVARLRQAFRVDLALRDLFEQPTVEGVVAALGRAWGDPAVVEEVAESYLALAGLSDEEVQALLAQEDGELELAEGAE